MRLSDTDFRERLTRLPTNLPSNHLQLIAEGQIPVDLEALLRNGKIIIDPWRDPCEIMCCTLDLHLGDQIEMALMPLQISIVDGRKVIRPYVYDARGNSVRLLETDRVVEHTEHGSYIRFMLKDDETLEMPPKSFLITRTLERIYIPTDLVMYVEGRSRFARKGITAHISSPRFDPGWCGPAVLEIANEGLSGFNIYPGLEFATMTLDQLTSKVDVPYFAKRSAKFRGQQS